MLLSLFSQMFFCRNEYIYYPVFTCKRIECNERFPQSEKVVIESYFLIAKKVEKHSITGQLPCRFFNGKASLFLTIIL